MITSYQNPCMILQNKTGAHSLCLMITDVTLPKFSQDTVQLNWIYYQISYISSFFLIMFIYLFLTLLMTQTILFFFIRKSIMIYKHLNKIIVQQYYKYKNTFKKGRSHFYFPMVLHSWVRSVHWFIDVQVLAMYK